MAVEANEWRRTVPPSWRPRTCRFSAHSPKADVAHNHDHATNAPYIPRGHEEGCAHSSGRRRSAFVLLASCISGPLTPGPGYTEGVGKSTIITSLIKESYVAHVRNPVVGCTTRWSDIVDRLGTACRTRSHHPARSHTGEHYNLHCRLRVCVRLGHTRF